MPTTFGRAGVVAATAISALGLFTTPIASHAAPACDLYGFAGDVTITGNGAITELNFSANGTSAHGTATAMGDKGGSMTGIIAGGIVENGPRLHLTFTPDSGGSYVFTGYIREDTLIATGTQGPGTWSTVGPLACLQAGPGPDPPDLGGDHMFQLSGDVDMYDKPGGNGNKLGVADGKPDGPQVNLIGCQSDNWCQIAVPPDNQFVWVWGGFVPAEARF
jgi:hypothetical protein